MKYAIGLLTAATVLFGGVATAQAGDITADVDCCTFVGGPFEQGAGEVPTFVNPPDAGFHDVTSTDAGPDGKALFASGTISAGATAPVRGAQYLGTGTYHFFCTIHGPSMSGDIVVTDGEPVARPKVRLKIPFQKLKRVRRSGKLKVKVTGMTKARGVKLAVSKGKKTLGKASKVAVAKGKTRLVKVKLTGKGKRLIKRGKRVSFKVGASLDFGRPAKKTRRTLR